MTLSPATPALDRGAFQSAISIVLAVSEAIREAKRIPAGIVYAAVMDKIDLATFNKVIALLVDKQMVRRMGDQLSWIGDQR